MRMEIPENKIYDLVCKQIANLFILDDDAEKKLLREALPKALERSDFCFSKSKNKYYRRNEVTYFNPFHSGQYTIFLYFLGNTVFTVDKTKRTLADKIYYLNKALNSLDLFYEVKMPEVFFLDHPVGSVMGRATYGEYFSFSQNCTVGNNKNIFPVIGRNVKMLSGSKILGHCHIGDDVILAANTYIKDTDIPDCSIVFGSSPNLTIKPNSAI